MTEEIISFETAVIAKEKGFDDLENCFCGYNPNEKKLLDYGLWPRFRTLYPKESIGAPTQCLLQRWLREKHKRFIYCAPRAIDGIVKWSNNISVRENIFYDTYEEALETGLFESLKLIKNGD